MAKAKRFFNSHRIFFGLFFSLLVYEILVGGHLSKWEVNEHFITFYTVDFGLGFCSRFLPGAVYRFLFRETSVATASLFSAALLLLFFAGVCLLLEKLVKRAPEEHRLPCLFCVGLFLTGPAGVSLFVRWLGVLDFYWVFAVLLFFIFLSHKRLYFLIPLPFALCCFVHYGAMVCYIPMMAILLLYKAAVVPDRREKKYLLTAFAVGVALAIGTAGYFMLFEKQNLVYPVLEFNRILRSRGANYTYYYDYDLYRVAVSEAGEVVSIDPQTDLPFFGRLLHAVRAQIDTTFGEGFKSGSMLELSLAGLALAPVLAGCGFSVKALLSVKEKKNGLRTFSLLLLLPLFLLTLTFGTFFSTDTFRWLTHLILPQLAALLYVSYYEGNVIFAEIKRRFAFVPPPAAAAYLVLFAALAPST